MQITDALPPLDFAQLTAPVRCPAEFTLDENVAVSCALMDTLDRLEPQLDHGPKGVGERYFWTHAALCKLRGF